MITCVGPGAIRRLLMDRPDAEIDALHAAEGALDLREIFVGTHRVFGSKDLLGDRGAQDVEAIEGRLGLDGLLLAPVREGRVGDGDLEVLGHLEAAQHLADP